MALRLDPSEKKAAVDSDGTDESFADLVSRYKHHVFRLAARFARNPYELEDLCQEVFLKVYECLDSFRHEAPFEHWLSRITVNTCYDMLRKAKRSKDTLSFEQLPYEPMDPAWEADAESRQAYEALMRGVSRLRPKERIVITLLELEEKSVQEVAKLTGWSEGNVRVRAHRARQSLKEILEKEL